MVGGLFVLGLIAIFLLAVLPCVIPTAPEGDAAEETSA